MTWSDTLTNEGYHVTATVCLAHARFAPCRKKGPHEYSTRPGDLAMVQYYHHMSAREARIAERNEPEYELETSSWQDRFITHVEKYGEQYIGCGGHVLKPANRNVDPPKLVLQACDETFDGWTLRMLAGELENHYTTVEHYQFKSTGRKRNAEPDAGNSSTG